MNDMSQANTKSTKFNFIRERTFQLSCAFLIKPIKATYKDEIDELLMDIDTSVYRGLQTVVSAGRVIAIEFKSDLEEDFWPSSIDEMEQEIVSILETFTKYMGGYKSIKA